MGIVAGFLVQNTLKYLLQFGEVTHYLGYSALNDFFPTMRMKPNPNCEDRYCRKRQEEYAAKPKPVKEENVAKTEEKPLHEENEWGISLVDESATPEEVPKSVAEGLSYAYEEGPKVLRDEANPQDDVNLDELMAQMKSM